MPKREVVALDIGGTNLRYGLVRNNKIIRFVRRPTPSGKEALLNAIFNSIDEMIENENNVRGIGIASPGPLRNGIILNPPNISLKNFDLKKAVQKEARMKVEIDNDAKCVALAESVLGVRKKNFFVLTLGTGIGGGVVIDGKVYNSRDIGTELGDIYLTSEKRFEELASGKAISQRTQEIFGRELLVQDLLRTKGKRAKKVLDEVVEYLGQGIGSLINIFNPEIVVLAGGMREAGEEFLKRIEEEAKKYISLPKEYDIVWSKLKEPGVLGASLLID